MGPAPAHGGVRHSLCPALETAGRDEPLVRAMAFGKQTYYAQ